MTTAARPGRNDPCPCGSGRKFKKCHGGPDRALPLANEPLSPSGSRGGRNGVLAANQTSASVPLGGFPGQNQHYIVVNQFEDGRPSHPAGHPGEYKVVFVFSRPGRAPRTERDLSFDLSSEGDSHLSINAPDVRPARTERGNVTAMHLEHTHNGGVVHLTCHSNAQGFIAATADRRRFRSFLVN